MFQTLKKLFIYLCAGVMLAPQLLFAQTKYVSDELQITLRTGPALDRKITKMLTSGAPVEVISTNDDGYSRIKTLSGSKGWVLNRFLMDTPSARSRLNVISEKEVLFLEQTDQIESLRQEVTNNAREIKQVNTKNTQLVAELKQVKRVAADTLAINKKNKKLEVSLSKAEAKQADLLIENSSLRKNTEQAWFLRGAGVILLGMILGLLVPKLRSKKKGSWGGLNSYN